MHDATSKCLGGWKRLEQGRCVALRTFQCTTPLPSAQREPDRTERSGVHSSHTPRAPFHIKMFESGEDKERLGGGRCHGNLVTQTTCAGAASWRHVTTETRPRARVVTWESRPSTGRLTRFFRSVIGVEELDAGALLGDASRWFCSAGGPGAGWDAAGGAAAGAGDAAGAGETDGASYKPNCIAG